VFEALEERIDHQRRRLLDLRSESLTCRRSELRVIDAQYPRSRRENHAARRRGSDHDFVDKFLPSGRSHVMALDGAQRRVQLVDDRHAGWDLKVRNRVIGYPIEIFQERPERVAVTRNENAPT
jgi:hypothetical protein